MDEDKKEPTIHPGSDGKPFSISDMDINEISIMVDYLYDEWRSVDIYLEEMGQPMIVDGAERTLLQRVRDLYDDKIQR